MAYQVIADMLYVICIVYLFMCIPVLIIFYLKKTPSSLPEGPVPLPFLGNYSIYRNKSVHLALTKLISKYGRVFSIKIGRHRAVVLNSREWIRAAFSQMELCGRPTAYPMDAFSQGNYGLSASSGQSWSNHRRFLSYNLRDLGPGKEKTDELLLNHVKELVTKVNHLGKGHSPIDLSRNIKESVAQSLWHVLSGHSNKPASNWFLQTISMLETAKANFTDLLISSFSPQFLMFWKSEKKKRESLEALETHLGREISNIIDDHKQTFNNNDFRDFIDVYLWEMEENRDAKCSIWQLRSCILDMYIWGLDTVSNTLCWSVLLIALNLDVQKKLQKEIDHVVGQFRDMNYKDKHELHYTQAVISEIHRFSSICPLGFVHEAIEDCELKPYTIPKGTLLVANLYAANRDPRVWKEPFKFNPDHFLDSEGKFFPNKDGLMAYSTGKRSCIGESLSQTMLLTYLVTLVQQFHFKIKDRSKLNEESLEGLPTHRRCPEYQVTIEKRIMENKMEKNS